MKKNWIFIGLAVLLGITLYSPTIFAQSSAHLAFTDEELDCSDDSSHPGICPSGYSCQHQSMGIGFCVVQSSNQCSTANPSGTIETATSTINRSCSCDYKGGGYAWTCSDSITTKAPVCTDPRPAGDFNACICQLDSSGKPTWQCSYNPPSTNQNTQTPSNTTNTNGGKIGYIPLEPLPGLTENDLKDLDFAHFVQNIFKLLLTAGALFAVILLVFGGISYMVSRGSMEMGEAKRRIMAAFWGMVILLGAWLMLYTINPALLNLNLNITGNPSANTGAQNTQNTNATQVTPTTQTTASNAQQTFSTDDVILMQPSLCAGHSSNCKLLHQYLSNIDDGASADIIRSYTTWCEGSHTDDSTGQSRTGIVQPIRMSDTGKHGLACILP